MVQPGNPIVGGTVLRIPAIQSPNFVTGSTGWAINQDGTAEFNGLTLHGTLVLGTGGTNVIVLDFAHRAILVYDNAGNLIASISPAGGTDSLGNVFQSGICSYSAGNVANSAQLLNNELQFNLSNGALPQPAVTALTGASVNNQPSLYLTSGNLAAVTAQAFLLLFGATTTAAPLAWLGRNDGVAMDVLVSGITKWAAPTVGVPVAETWHALPLSANWSNLGAPWANGSYRRLDHGVVRLSGAIQWTAAASNAPVQVTTALPAAYRPAAQHRCMTMSMGNDTSPPTVESFDVHTDGTLWITSFANGTGPITPITLDNVSWPVDL